MTEPHIDLEEIAAFVDGRLSGERRARMIKLLAESPAAYEIFVETVRFQDEQESKRGGVIPFPHWKVWVPLAAAAAIAVMVGVRSAGRSGALPAEAPSSAALVASLSERGGFASALGPDWDQRSWSVTRGGPARLVEPQLAFRLGARAVDLQVALTLGQTGPADQVLAEILEWLADVQMSQAVAAQYAALRIRLTAESAGRLAAEAAGVERDLESLLGSPRFTLGRWAAAAELAARTADPAFFTSPSAGRLFDAVRRLELSDADVAALRRIADLSRGHLGDDQFQELQALVREIIGRNAG